VETAVGTEQETSPVVAGVETTTVEEIAAALAETRVALAETRVTLVEARAEVRTALEARVQTLEQKVTTTVSACLADRY